MGLYIRSNLNKNTPYQTNVCNPKKIFILKTHKEKIDDFVNYFKN